MCPNPVSGTQDITSANTEKWCRRLTVCLLGGLIIAFMLLPDCLIAAPDNATAEQAKPEQVKAETGKFRWKFIICFPMPVDVLPTRSSERRRLGGAGLISSLGKLTVNDLIGLN